MTPSTSRLPPKPDHEPKRRLNEAEWQEIATLWELGTVTLADLEKKFGLTPVSLSRGLTARGSVRGSKAHLIAARVESEVTKSVTDAVVAEAVPFALDRASRIESTKNDSYKWAEMIGKLTVKELAKVAKAGGEFSGAFQNLKALAEAMKIVQQQRQERYAILDIENDIPADELPELLIRELTAVEIDEKRNKSVDLLDEVVEEMTAVIEAEEIEDIVTEDG